MKVARLARLLPALLLVVAPFMQGCGNFWQAPSGSTGSSGTTSTTLSSGIFYVLNQTTAQIVAYQINSGSLNLIKSYALSAGPFAIAIAPNNGFLYVSTIAGIYLYTIDSGGLLTIGNNGSAISDDEAEALEVDTSGKWLVDAETGTSGIIVNAISIDPSNGALNSTVEETQSFNIANNPSVQKMAISGDDAQVFLALGTGGTLIVPFASSNANPLGGTAKTIPLFASDGSSLSVAVDPIPSGGTTPRLFYVGETQASSNSGGLRVFNYSSLSSGSVTEIGSPYSAGGLAPTAILPDATGDYVYVASGQGTSNGVIQGFNIASSGTGSTTTYSLSSISKVATGITPDGLAEDSLGNFVLAVSSGGSYDLEAYIFDTTTLGQLDDTINATTGTDPTGAVAVAAQAP